MKNLLIVLILFSISLISYSQDIKALDNKYGFREAKFESPLSSFNDLIKVHEEKGGLVHYTSTHENLKIGDYAFSEIRYIFYKDQLAVVLLVTEGESNSQGILKILQSAYGKGYQDNEYIEEYSWFGGKVAMLFKQNSATGDAEILIWSNKLSDLRQADNDKANSEAASQL